MLILQYLNHGSEAARNRITHQTRTQIPRAFFKAVSMMTQHKKPTFFVKHFKSKIIDDQVVKAKSIATYMQELYKQTTPYSDPCD